MSDLLSRLEALGSPRVAVLGDLMLDCYTSGNVERVSPEAPVLVLRVDQREWRLGGAASVAALLRGLDVGVCAVGAYGGGRGGRASQAICRLLGESGIERDGVVMIPDRVTTIKERFIGRAASRHPHQILRVDEEETRPIGETVEAQLLRPLRVRLEEVNGLLISDYNKGVCTPGLLRSSVDLARDRQLPVIVDPARIADYSRYRGATVLIPNRAEAACATGMEINTPADALAAAQKLSLQTGIPAVIVKLDSDGMVLFETNGTACHFPTRPRAVYDVTGAGDMVLAVVGVCLAAGVPLAEAVELANIAAGLEVERQGVAVVTRDEIRRALQSESDEQEGLCRDRTLWRSADVSKPTGLINKLIAGDVELLNLANQYRRSGKTLVFTNGCFDLLHVGHAAYLRQAAALGDILIVGVNSDASVRRLKGFGRPVIDEQSRSELLAALECVDHVIIFDEDTPCDLLRVLRPDILVKGGTYSVDEVVGREIVESYGGQVCVTGEIPGISTTHILKQLTKVNGGH